MIHALDHSTKSTELQKPDWVRELQQAFKTPAELFDFLQIQDDSLTQGATKGDALFPILVPKPFAARMAKGNLQDPLLLQVLPQAQESLTVPGFTTDPLAEQNSDYNPIPGLVHKYKSRVLLITSGTCAVNCRYCFRRHFPYHDNNPGRPGWLKAINYIQAHPEINEVILSGGDPLTLKDSQLGWLTAALEQAPHLKNLRIHTRLPVVIPNRITAELANLLTQTRFNTSLVTHINHPNEIDQAVQQSLLKLKNQGITLLNQGLLLKGINDCSEILTALSYKLYQAGVLPYYLHLLDPVAGAAHFDISEHRARALIIEMMAELPGYLVPKLAREQAGAAHKLTLSPF